MRLYVGNLSFNTEEPQLEQLFSSHGAVESVHLVRDHATGRPLAPASTVLKLGALEATVVGFATDRLSTFRKAVQPQPKRTRADDRRAA